MTAEEGALHGAGAPDPTIRVPPEVLALAAGQRVRPVWENHLGAVTVEVGEGDGRQFVKWVPRGVNLDLGAEAERMRWASRFTSVPVVVDVGRDESGSWLVTEALYGEMAVTPRWKADPATAVRAIGKALRAFHDALPVSECPFSLAADDQIADARRRAAAGEIDPGNWHDVHKPLGVDGALARLAEVPPIDKLVVCHGDTCAPNLLIGDDGRPTGWVDLGDLGVADRWADLAIATWSSTWNYGPGWEQPLLDAYGIAPDPERTAFYRLLYELWPD